MVAWELILDILAIIALLICVLMLIAFIYSMQKASNDIKPNKLSRGLTYSAIILFTISMLTYPMSDMPGLNDWQFAIFIIAGLTTGAWNMGQFFVFLVLMERNINAFNNTQYASSKCTYISMSILLLLYLLSIVSYIIWSVFTPYKEIEDIYGDMYAIGEEVIDMILSVYLVAIFIKKLFHVTVDLDDNKAEMFVNSQTATLNQHQKQLLHLMTKYCILTFSSTLTTQLVCLIWTFGYFLPQYYAISYISYVLWPIDCAVNCICLVLIFDINEIWYIKICKGCHSWIRLFFKSAAKKRLKKKYMSEIHNAEYEMQLLSI